MHATRIARNATRSMRIVALPLTRPPKPLHGNAAGQLTYYHFITPPENTKTTTWAKWAVTKASDLWAGFGKAPEGHWKRRAFVYGERLIDRLEFEELALKSLDPSLGPSLSSIVHPSAKEETAPVHIPLVYPPSACASPLPHLQTLVEKRAPRHKKGFVFWLAVSPLTAPFMIIPIIPNFPFFFCIWRSWSHYRAYKASHYLEGFLKQGAIAPQASTALDAIYAKYAPQPVSAPTPSAAVEHSAGKEQPPPASEHASQSPEDEHDAAAHGVQLLLTKEAVPELEQALAIPEGSTFAADVYRALEQARLRLSEGGRKA
ncbi:mitochondrial K+-H+ exchange-related-domain-containing protein [Lenzites betulinus]|nr:mitochondrial K+-H+ exchange-related-domain-containing protein [Lenzites betulinus]